MCAKRLLAMTAQSSDSLQFIVKHALKYYNNPLEMDIDINEDIDFEVLPELTPEEEQKLQQEHEEKVRNFYTATH